MINNTNYSKKVIRHFRNPHNLGKIADPDGVGEVGNIACGDVMKLYIKMGMDRQKREIIKDVKFETYGCAAAIATSSAVTDLVKKMTIDEALSITNEQIIKDLGGLPPVKIHCSLLAVDALDEAIYNYLQSKKAEIPKKLDLIHKRIKVVEKHGHKH